MKDESLSFVLYDAMHTIAGVLTNNIKSYKRPPTREQPNPQYCPEAQRGKVQDNIKRSS